METTAAPARPGSGARCGASRRRRGVSAPSAITALLGCAPPRGIGLRQRIGERGPRWRALAPWVAAALLVVAEPVAAQLTLQDNRLFDEADFDTAEPFNGFGVVLARCDFDGDGYDDLAIGSPGADLLGVISDAGKVHVAYGGQNGLTVAGHQTVVQPLVGEDPPTEDGLFGEALAGGDFDGDGYCDLAVGRPSASFNGLTEAGLVHVFEGTEDGLDTSISRLWWQDELGIADDSESGDRFGAPLAAADFDGDGYDDLVIAVPFEDGGAGAVHVLFGSPGGLTSADDDFIAQGDALGTVGVPEAGDGFGAVLAVGLFDDADLLPDLAIAAPLEDVGAADIGWVHVFFPDEDGFVSRLARQQQFDPANVGQAAEDGDAFGIALAAGDFDGDGLDELAIGSEDGIAAAGDRAGSVTVLTHGPTGVLTSVGAAIVTQDTKGVSDTAETSDVFGGALAAGDFDGDGRDDLAIGVPNENFEGGGLINNGALHVLYGSAAGLGTVGQQFHGQGVWGAGATESGDFFGEELIAADFDGDGVWSLAIGVPREDRGVGADAGVVVLITGELRRLFADGFESGDTNAWSAGLP